MTNEELIREVQAELGIEVDGKAGPETWTAIYNRLVKPKPKLTPITAFSATVDPRSAKTIETLLPEVRPYAVALIGRAAAAGITIKIISGLRSYAEQDALYAQGRRGVAGESIVTKARGGYSNHNFGVAFDIGVFEGSKYLPESPKYKAVGPMGSELGLEWGGNWKTIVDQPHYQLRPAWAAALAEREMLAEFRARVAAGRALFP